MSGLSEKERLGFSKILHPEGSEKPVFMDAWRHLHPEEEEYTYVDGVLWSVSVGFKDENTRFHASKFGSWRLDSFIVSFLIVGRIGTL